jgi:uncharacterized protein
VPRLTFGGHDFTVVGGVALHWLSRNALIVADLHLEKASWFAQRGQMLPPYDSRATLDRLAALLAQTGAREVWCLGDNFHDDAGAARLPNDARALLASLTNAVQWMWITGNHDEHLPPNVGGTIVEEAAVDGLILRHYANAADPRPELSGHFHPKYRAEARGRGVSRPCFVRSATKLILPAFGALTGGLFADHPEITAAVGRGAEALVAVRGTVLRFGLTRSHPHIAV